MAVEDLSLKHKRFCEEFTHDYNGTRAYIRAGYSPKGAGQSSFDLLKNPDIQTYIAEIESKRVERSQLSNIRLMQEIERHALWDARNLYDEENNAIALAALDDDTAAGITSVEILEEFEGSGKDRVLCGYTKKVKGPNKLAALELLVKMRGLLIERKQIEGEITILTPEQRAAAIAEIKQKLLESGE